MLVCTPTLAETASKTQHKTERSRVKPAPGVDHPTDSVLSNRQPRQQNLDCIFHDLAYFSVCGGGCAGALRLPELPYATGSRQNVSPSTRWKCPEYPKREVKITNNRCYPSHCFHRPASENESGKPSNRLWGHLSGHQVASHTHPIRRVAKKKREEKVTKRGSLLEMASNIRVHGSTTQSLVCNTERVGQLGRGNRKRHDMPRRHALHLLCDAWLCVGILVPQGSKSLRKSQVHDEKVGSCPNLPGKGASQKAAIQEWRDSSTVTLSAQPPPLISGVPADEP